MAELHRIASGGGAGGSGHHPEECAICVEALASLTETNVSVLADAANVRTCPHYYQ